MASSDVLAAASLPRDDAEDDVLCTIEASVVTGFEESARGEAKEKFDTDVKAARGKLTWRVPLKKVKDVLKMGSVDNCRVVIHSVPCFKFTDQHDSLARLQKMVKDIDWQSGLKAWQHVYNFPYPIATHPEGVVSEDDLVDVVIITNQPAPKNKSGKKNKNKKGWGKKKKEKKKNETGCKREQIVSCESGVDIPAVGQSTPGRGTGKTEDVEDSKSELCAFNEKCPKSPVNEKGDGSAQMVSDALTSQKETELREMDGCHSPKAEDNTKIRLQFTTEDFSLLDSGVVNGTSLGGEHEAGKEWTEDFDSVKLEMEDSADITARTPKPVFGDSASPAKESAAASRASPAGSTISESEFASIVIRRLTSPPESASKGDTPGTDSPQMLCVTPPPTPIRTIDNPFSNLQDRIHAELLPLPASAINLPGRSSINPDTQQDHTTASGSSVDSPLSAINDKTQAKSASPSTPIASSDISSVPLLSALASSAFADRNTDPMTELSSGQSSSPRQPPVDDCVPEEKKLTSEGTSAVKKVRDPTKPTFRVTCNRTGDSHAFDSSSAAASFGSAIITYLSWQVDLKNFDIEVILNIDNEEVTVCLALTKMSLHYRNLVAFGPTTLRATICYNMLRLCRIKNGDFICDPMCGTSAIPIEGAHNWANCYHFGGDFHDKAIEKTVLNMAAVQEQMKISNKKSLKLDAVQWDVQRLPLRDTCVDVFVSDLPFGHRIGSRCDNPVLYSGLLLEMARTARPGARACLLTEDKFSLTKVVQTLGRYWQRRLILNINIGGLSGFVFLLTRTTSAVVHSTTDWRDGMDQPAAGETVSAESSETSSSIVQDVEGRSETE